MKFLVDTQLPPRLSSYLRSRGHDCIHTTHFEDGQFLTDAQIIRIAIREKRTVISKDSDFKDTYLLKGTPPRILLLTFGNISNQELISYFENYLDELIRLFSEGYDFVQFSRAGISVG
jgi:predicted nuclease of predicted toxin-antitoxin system